MLRRLTQVTTPITTENYEYDILQRLNKISQEFFSNRYGSKYTYQKIGDHATNRVNSIAYLKNGVSDGKINYTYDKMGNVSKIYENGELAISYVYDR